METTKKPLNEETQATTTPSSPDLIRKIESISKLLLLLVFTQTFTVCLLAWIITKAIP